MKTFKVEYEEVISYTFYVNAESEDDVTEAFNREVDNHNIDFNNGEIVHSNIVHIKEV